MICDQKFYYETVVTSFCLVQIFVWNQFLDRLAQLKTRGTLQPGRKDNFIFSMALPAHSGPRPLIQFRNHFLQTVGLLGRMGNPSQRLYLNTGQHKHRINAYAYAHQTYMPSAGFEPTIPAVERAKAVHALDRAATLTGRKYNYIWIIGNLWRTGLWWPLRSKTVEFPPLTIFIGSTTAIVLKVLLTEYRKYILKA
jgi:hypothetical protein